MNIVRLWLRFSSGRTADADRIVDQYADREGLVAIGGKPDMAVTSADFRVWALFGHGLMSDLSPLSGVERKSNFRAVRSVDDPKRTFHRNVG